MVNHERPAKGRVKSTMRSRSSQATPPGSAGADAATVPSASITASSSVRLAPCCTERKAVSRDESGDQVGSA
jgi:hypothetical protein